MLPTLAVAVDDLVEPSRRHAQASAPIECNLPSALNLHSILSVNGIRPTDSAPERWLLVWREIGKSADGYVRVGVRT